MSSLYEQQKGQYLQHLDGGIGNDNRSGRREEMRTAPLLSLAAKHAVDHDDEHDIDFSYASTSSGSDEQTTPSDVVFPQYSLLGFQIGRHEHIAQHEPILFNTNAPNSIFICGSQGSGKSHTLSCMLENCLLQDDGVGTLAKPLGGVVFHYDVGGNNSLAEAASLSSRGIPVRVLVSPSNYRKLSEAYGKQPGTGKITVSTLRFGDSDLNADRMLKLMAFSESEGSVPLYMEVIQRILRQRAMEGKPFSFKEFEGELDKQQFTPGQQSMMNMRLDLLKSFFATATALRGGRMSLWEQKAAQEAAARQATGWNNAFVIDPGELLIIELTDPFIDSATACVLFDVCLGLIENNRPASGLIVALDEAHKYLHKSTAAANLTENLITTIREQRHNATRVVIATQEPTISEKLLDLCSVSIVHRFTSPAWFGAIKDHLGGASSLTTSGTEQNGMFEEIVDLLVGESLVFSPSAYVCVVGTEAKKLGSGVVKMKTRMRQGADSGMSKLAVGRFGALALE
ncbi:hypothetical protein LTR08_002108 [Meristemomyces frigidus]|nr:hypothetical protein LTR08_002108 [Meristemomyces frigidus]